MMINVGNIFKFGFLVEEIHVLYMPVGPPLKVARNCNALAVEKANNIETLPTPVNQCYRNGGLKHFG